MKDERKIKTAALSLILAGSFEAINSFVQVSERVHNILWGFQLILLLVALSISAKMIGNFGAEKKIKNLAKLILILAAFLGIYVFII